MKYNLNKKTSKKKKEKKVVGKKTMDDHHNHHWGLLKDTFIQKVQKIIVERMLKRERECVNTDNETMNKIKMN